MIQCTCIAMWVLALLLGTALKCRHLAAHALDATALRDVILDTVSDLEKAVFEG